MTSVAKISSRLVTQDVWTVGNNGVSRPGGVPAALQPALVDGRAPVLEFLADGVMLGRTPAWQRAGDHVAPIVATCLRRLVTERDRLLLFLTDGVETLRRRVDGRSVEVGAASEAYLDHVLGRRNRPFLFQSLASRDAIGAYLFFEPPLAQLKTVVRRGWDRGFRAFVVPRASFQPRSRTNDVVSALDRAISQDPLEQVRRELAVATIVCEAWSDESALRIWSTKLRPSAIARRLGKAIERGRVNAPKSSWSGQ